MTWHCDKKTRVLCRVIKFKPQKVPQVQECPKEKEEEKTTQAVKNTPHINEGKGAILVPSTVKLLHREKERKNQWGSGGLQAWPETGS
jgi:hypothetical protein